MYIWGIRIGPGLVLRELFTFFIFSTQLGVLHITDLRRFSESCVRQMTQVQSVLFIDPCVCIVYGDQRLTGGHTSPRSGIDRTHAWGLQGQMTTKHTVEESIFITH